MMKVTPLAHLANKRNFHLMYLKGVIKMVNLMGQYWNIDVYPLIKELDKISRVIDAIWKERRKEHV